MLRRALLAALVTVSSLAIIGLTADEALACTNGNCGDSITYLYFYTAGGESSVTSMPYGQPLLISALVSDDSGSCGTGQCDTPSGHVYFYDNGDPGYFAVSPTDPNFYTPPTLTDSNRSFDTVVSNLSVGNHSIRAHYSGGISSVNNPHPFNDSEDTKSILITKANTSATLTSSSPSASYGTAVTFTATVVSNPTASADVAKPSGTVSLVDTTGGGARLVEQKTLDQATGQVTFTESDLPVGSRTLEVVYLGDANYELVHSPGISQTITQAASTTTLTSSSNPSTFGSAVTFTATLNSTSASGTVTFAVDGNLQSPATVQSGKATFTTSTLTAGTHTIAATYSGDNNFTGSSSSGFTQTVNKVDTTGVIQSSPNPSVYGQTVNLSGTVSPSTATGPVTFYDGPNPLGNSTAPNPTGSTSSLSVGSHSLSFIYGGDSNHNASFSNTITHVVNKADTSIALTGPSSAVDFGSSVPISAAVSAVAPGAGTPTGTLTLYEGAQNLGSGTLSGGQVTISVPDLLPGSHNVTAVYNGDGNFNGSSSSTPLAITLTCQNNVSGPSVGTVTAGSDTSTCVTADVSTLVIPSRARVFVSGAQIRTVSSRGAARIAICGSTLLGSVSISEATGPVLLGDTTKGCAGNTFKGSTSLTFNRGFVTVADNVLVGLTASYNRGGVLIANNQLSGAMSCQSNVPAPTNGGRPNTGGTRSGQCIGL